MEFKKRLKHETAVSNSEGVTTVTRKDYSMEVSIDEYYYNFIKFISPIYELTCITDAKILAYMCENCEFNTAKVRITAADRKKLLGITGVKTQAISNAIARLKGLGLVSGEGGVYMLNPEIWWKGNMKTRRELLESDGFTVSVLFKKTLQNIDGKLVDIETGEVK